MRLLDLTLSHRYSWSVDSGVKLRMRGDPIESRRLICQLLRVLDCATDGGADGWHNTINGVVWVKLISGVFESAAQQTLPPICSHQRSPQVENYA